MACTQGCKDAPDKSRELCPEEGSCPHYRKYCPMLEVKDSEFELAIGMAMPVTQELQDYISAWVVPLKLDRTVQRLRQQFVDEAAPDVCSAEISETQALGIEDMAGTFFFSGVIM